MEPDLSFSDAPTSTVPGQEDSLKFDFLVVDKNIDTIFVLFEDKTGSNKTLELSQLAIEGCFHPKLKECDSSELPMLLEPETISVVQASA